MQGSRCLRPQPRCAYSYGRAVNFPGNFSWNLTTGCVLASSIRTRKRRTIRHSRHDRRPSVRGSSVFLMPAQLLFLPMTLFRLLLQLQRHTKLCVASSTTLGVVPTVSRVLSASLQRLSSSSKQVWKNNPTLHPRTFNVFSFYLICTTCKRSPH